jgi:hypothetical protein
LTAHRYFLLASLLRAYGVISNKLTTDTCRRRDEEVADNPVRWGIFGTGGIEVDGETGGTVLAQARRNA